MPRSFPKYLIEKEGWEPPANNLAWDRSYHVKWLIAADQYLGLNSAMLYLKKEIIDQPERRFTAKLMIKIAKQLQRYTTDSLLALECNGVLGGNYADEGGWIFLNPISKGNTFVPPKNSKANEHNARILAQKHSQSAGREYLTYCEKITNYKRSQLRQIGSDQGRKYALEKKTELSIARELGLNNDSGLKWYKTIVRMLDEPDLTIKQVAAWAQKLAESLNRQEDPYILAAQALQLSAVHPFRNGNGRTSRLLANAILLSRGIDAVDLGSSMKEEYYQAVSQSETSLQPLVDLLKKASASVPAGQAELPTVHEITRIQPLAVDRIVIYAFPGGYHLVIDEDRARYERQQLSEQNLDSLSTLHTQAAADAKSCEAKAKLLSNDKPDIAIFYWYKAATFLIDQGQIEQACQRYLTAAKLCIKEEFFDGAYDLLCRCRSFAEQNQLKPIKREIESLLESINFVCEYKKKLSTIEAQELIRYSDAQSSSAHLITQFSSVLQVDTPQAASSNTEQAEQSAPRATRP